MASHGVPRQSLARVRSPEDTEEERRKIKIYRDLDQSVHEKISQRQYTPESLAQISNLLKDNPEYYTIWNYRRLIRRHEFLQATTETEDQTRNDRLVEIITTDLEFLFPLLRSFPKCYWIWNYRMWLLDEAKRLLPGPIARKFWQNELVLVGKMLNADSRNFHGWGYRRYVVQALEDFMTDEVDRHGMTQSELDYTTKMIKTNLSNFSAWHNRTKLIQKLLNEKGATDADRKKVLEEELKFAHAALIDPYDQSLWFHHQNLICVFDPSLAAHTMAPNLSNAERLEYVRQEKEAIQDMLDGDEDCKWIYEALIHCDLVAAKIEGTMSTHARTEVSQWLDELMKLDPLRKNRWLDLAMSIKR